MPKIFERIGLSRPKYSAFDLSHEKKLSMKMGKLVPVYTQEVLPGDQFKVNTEVMLRMSPMLAPVMHRVNVYIHYFFVPNRLLWTSWEDFITGGREGTSVPTMPTISLTDAMRAKAGLADYLGIPIAGQGGGGAVDPVVNKLAFTAYQQIWIDYYRDPTLDVAGEEAHAYSDVNLTTLRDRCWEKDYFTSALPWPQRGTEVTVPVDVLVSDVVDYPSGAPAGDTADLQVQSGNLYDNTGAQALALEGESVSLTINELRNSSALQRFLEKNARGGYRYIENILAHFGVKSSDARLQRPEYLGGGRQPVVISEVLNTTSTDSADMTGHGIAVGNKNSFRRTFEEHGFVMGIMSVIPRTAYQQGIHRMHTRTSKEDFYWPDFANLGEQEILNKEIYFDEVTSANNENVFGYQQRYAEYKYQCDTVHGDFKDNLDFWHMGRIFSSAPALNSTFVRSDPTTRIFAVPTGDTLWCQLYHNIKARRPMPYFANPSLK